MDLELNYAELRRFWANVKAHPKTGCWEWTGNLTSDKGSGRRLPQFFLKGQKIGARRLAYHLYFGEVPPRVGCSCDNNLCVNPQHLLPFPEKKTIVKTYKTMAKQLKVNAKLARRVIRLRANGCTQPAIARKTGLGQASVCLILKMARFCKEGRLGRSPVYDSAEESTP